MPKTIYTPRDELVCGKLDDVVERLIVHGKFRAHKEGIVQILGIVKAIRHDVERMELKLISRKSEEKNLALLVELHKENLRKEIKEIRGLFDGMDECFASGGYLALDEIEKRFGLEE